MSQLFASDGQTIGASASVLPSVLNEYSGLICFRIDWFDLLAVQWTLESLLQHQPCIKSIHSDCWDAHGRKFTYTWKPRNSDKRPRDRGEGAGKQGTELINLIMQQIHDKLEGTHTVFSSLHFQSHYDLNDLKLLEEAPWTQRLIWNRTMPAFWKVSPRKSSNPPGALNYTVFILLQTLTYTVFSGV